MFYAFSPFSATMNSLILTLTFNRFNFIYFQYEPNCIILIYLIFFPEELNLSFFNDSQYKFNRFLCVRYLTYTYNHSRIFFDNLVIVKIPVNCEPITINEKPLLKIVLLKPVLVVTRSVLSAQISFGPCRAMFMKQLCKNRRTHNFFSHTRSPSKFCNKFRVSIKIDSKIYSIVTKKPGVKIRSILCKIFDYRKLDCGNFIDLINNKLISAESIIYSDLVLQFCPFSTFGSSTSTAPCSFSYTNTPESICLRKLNVATRPVTDAVVCRSLSNNYEWDIAYLMKTLSEYFFVGYRNLELPRYNFIFLDKCFSCCSIRSIISTQTEILINIQLPFRDTRVYFKKNHFQLAQKLQYRYERCFRIRLTYQQSRNHELLFHLYYEQPYLPNHFFNKWLQKYCEIRTNNQYTLSSPNSTRRWIFDEAIRSRGSWFFIRIRLISTQPKQFFTFFRPTFTFLNLWDSLFSTSPECETRESIHYKRQDFSYNPFTGNLHPFSCASFKSYKTEFYEAYKSQFMPRSGNNTYFTCTDDAVYQNQPHGVHQGQSEGTGIHWKSYSLWTMGQCTSSGTTRMGSRATWCSSKTVEKIREQQQKKVCWMREKCSLSFCHVLWRTEFERRGTCCRTCQVFNLCPCDTAVFAIKEFLWLQFVCFCLQTVSDEDCTATTTSYNYRRCQHTCTKGFSTKGFITKISYCKQYQEHANQLLATCQTCCSHGYYLILHVEEAKGSGKCRKLSIKKEESHAGLFLCPRNCSSAITSKTQHQSSNVHKRVDKLCRIQSRNLISILTFRKFNHNFALLYSCNHFFAFFATVGNLLIVGIFFRSMADFDPITVLLILEKLLFSSMCRIHLHALYFICFTCKIYVEYCLCFYRSSCKTGRACLISMFRFFVSFFLNPQDSQYDQVYFFQIYCINTLCNNMDHKNNLIPKLFAALGTLEADLFNKTMLPSLVNGTINFRAIFEFVRYQTSLDTPLFHIFSSFKAHEILADILTDFPTDDEFHKNISDYGLVNRFFLDRMNVTDELADCIVEQCLLTIYSQDFMIKCQQFDVNRRAASRATVSCSSSVCPFNGVHARVAYLVSLSADLRYSRLLLPTDLPVGLPIYYNRFTIAKKFTLAAITLIAIRTVSQGFCTDFELRLKHRIRSIFSGRFQQQQRPYSVLDVRCYNFVSLSLPVDQYPLLKRIEFDVPTHHNVLVRINLCGKSKIDDEIIRRFHFRAKLANALRNGDHGVFFFNSNLECALGMGDFLKQSHFKKVGNLLDVCDQDCNIHPDCSGVLIIMQKQLQPGFFADRSSFLQSVFSTYDFCKCTSPLFLQSNEPDNIQFRFDDSIFHIQTIFRRLVFDIQYVQSTEGAESFVFDDALRFSPPDHRNIHRENVNRYQFSQYNANYSFTAAGGLALIDRGTCLCFHHSICSSRATFILPSFNYDEQNFYDSVRFPPSRFPPSLSVAPGYEDVNDLAFIEDSEHENVAVVVRANCAAFDKLWRDVENIGALLHTFFSQLGRNDTVDSIRDEKFSGICAFHRNEFRPQKCFDDEPIFSSTEILMIYKHHHLLPSTAHLPDNADRRLYTLLTSQGKLLVILQREIERLNILLAHYFSVSCCSYLTDQSNSPTNNILSTTLDNSSPAFVGDAVSRASNALKTDLDCLVYQLDNLETAFDAIIKDEPDDRHVETTFERLLLETTNVETTVGFEYFYEFHINFILFFHFFYHFDHFNLIFSVFDQFFLIRSVAVETLINPLLLYVPTFKMINTSDTGCFYEPINVFATFGNLCAFIRHANMNKLMWEMISKKWIFFSVCNSVYRVCIHCKRIRLDHTKYLFHMPAVLINTAVSVLKNNISLLSFQKSNCIMEMRFFSEDGLSRRRMDDFVVRFFIATDNFTNLDGENNVSIDFRTLNGFVKRALGVEDFFYFSYHSFSHTFFRKNTSYTVRSAIELSFHSPFSDHLCSLFHKTPYEVRYGCDGFFLFSPEQFHTLQHSRMYIIRNLPTVGATYISDTIGQALLDNTGLLSPLVKCRVRSDHNPLPEPNGTVVFFGRSINSSTPDHYCFSFITFKFCKTISPYFSGGCSTVPFDNNNVIFHDVQNSYSLSLHEIFHHGLVSFVTIHSDTTVTLYLSQDHTVPNPKYEISVFALSFVMNDYVRKKLMCKRCLHNTGYSDQPLFLSQKSVCFFHTDTQCISFFGQIYEIPAAEDRFFDNLVLSHSEYKLIANRSSTQKSDFAHHIPYALDTRINKQSLSPECQRILKTKLTHTDQNISLDVNGTSSCKLDTNFVGNPRSTLHTPIDFFQGSERLYFIKSESHTSPMLMTSSLHRFKLHSFDTFPVSAYEAWSLQSQVWVENEHKKKTDTFTRDICSDLFHDEDDTYNGVDASDSCFSLTYFCPCRITLTLLFTYPRHHEFCDNEAMFLYRTTHQRFLIFLFIVLIYSKQPVNTCHSKYPSFCLLSYNTHCVTIFFRLQNTIKHFSFHCCIPKKSESILSNPLTIFKLYFKLYKFELSTVFFQIQSYLLEFHCETSFPHYLSFAPFQVRDVGLKHFVQSSCSPQSSKPTKIRKKLIKSFVYRAKKKYTNYLHFVKHTLSKTFRMAGRGRSNSRGRGASTRGSSRGNGQRGRGNFRNGTSGDADRNQPSVASGAGPTNNSNAQLQPFGLVNQSRTFFTGDSHSFSTGVYGQDFGLCTLIFTDILDRPDKIADICGDFDIRNFITNEESCDNFVFPETFQARITGAVQSSMMIRGLGVGFGLKPENLDIEQDIKPLQEYKSKSNLTPTNFDLRSTTKLLILDTYPICERNFIKKLTRHPITMSNKNLIMTEEYFQLLRQTRSYTIYSLSKSMLSQIFLESLLIATGIPREHIVRITVTSKQIGRRRSYNKHVVIRVRNESFIPVKHLFQIDTLTHRTTDALGNTVTELHYNFAKERSSYIFRLSDGRSLNYHMCDEIRQQQDNLTESEQTEELYFSSHLIVDRGVICSLDEWFLVFFFLVVVFVAPIFIIFS